MGREGQELPLSWRNGTCKGWAALFRAKETFRGFQDDVPFPPSIVCLDRRGKEKTWWIPASSQNAWICEEYEMICAKILVHLQQSGSTDLLGGQTAATAYQKHYPLWWAMKIKSVQTVSLPLLGLWKALRLNLTFARLSGPLQGSYEIHWSSSRQEGVRRRTLLSLLQELFIWPTFSGLLCSPVFILTALHSSFNSDTATGISQYYCSQICRVLSHSSPMWKAPGRPYCGLPVSEGGLQERCWGTSDRGMEWQDKG